MEHRQILLGPLVLVLVFPFCTSSIDTITPEQPLVDGSVLVSKENKFVLGFFTPGNSSYVYLGIWYVKIHEKTVVWVANRDNPINGSSGVLWIDAHGNLVLNQTNHNITLWSTNVQVSSTSGNRVAKLLNTGNLVLVEEKTDKEVWRSFDYPGNTMLPGMKLGVDLKSGLNRFLTSWKSPDDPGTGEYSVKLDTRGSPQFFLYKGSAPTWRTRSWPWTGILDSELAFFYNYSFINNDDEIYFVNTPGDDSVIMRLVVDDTGIFHTFTWLNASGQWKGFRPVPKSLCDPYGQCGAYGICDPNDVNRFECSCLPGFQPRSPGDWYLRDGSSGCVRKHGAYTCGDGGGGFLKVGKVKVPDTSSARVERGLDLRACEEACLSSCSCTGFSSISIDGESAVCLTWYGGLIDTVELSNGGWDFYVRVNAIDIAENARKSKGFLQKKGTIVIPIVSVSVALFLMAIFSYLCLMKKRIARDSLMTKVKLGESRTHTDLLFIDLSSIVSATNNFSPFNKLGEGGFDSVYKGQLPDGQEIAVKRLSKNSGQGIQEFKNEVAVIAKLQHRNLVKLLGSCIEGEETMLIYEYLRNKSLDSFIFDRTRRAILDWRKRFVIIVGIARGVLYLHQDSRLRIIHRDLKTSNILLDDDMNPKISDFGMARSFAGDEIQDMTKRVVGTYGYMSPEYAAFGKFSTKSDVFSFGVVLLEIISGKKNSCYYQDDPSLNLIGHVWGLWSRERALELVDSSLRESFLPQEVLRCIHIGLLCVQENVTDRPTMLEVVLMLVRETTLPFPKQPAFIFGTCNPVDSSPEGDRPCSVNDVTMSNVEAR